MSLITDVPLPSPPLKPKLTCEKRRRRAEDRLVTIRLRMAIWRALDDQGITTSTVIGAALGMPVAEATRLLTAHRWRQGDVEQLEAAAGRFEVQVPIQDLWRSWPASPIGHHLARSCSHPALTFFAAHGFYAEAFPWRRSSRSLA